MAYGSRNDKNVYYRIWDRRTTAPCHFWSMPAMSTFGLPKVNAQSIGRNLPILRDLLGLAARTESMSGFHMQRFGSLWSIMVHGFGDAPL
jgi:hypothetical protein